MSTIDKIKEKYKIKKITPLLKGWSKDIKYILEDRNLNRYLLRISDISLFEKKKKQFELLKKLELLNINCSRAIEFGTLDDDKVYIVLSYLEGQDAKEIISKLTNLDAYNLGFDAGKTLKKLHDISIPIQDKTWWERYQVKMVSKIDNILKCIYRIPMQEEIVEFYKSNAYLMKNRPLLFSHGDYHLGNMVFKNGKLGIIDFDKNTIADPYDEFKPYCWNTIESEYFETGLINGYFNDQVPDDFFRILKFYTAESLISHLPWAVTYGEEEIKTAKFVAEQVMIWYNNFKLDIPTWYKGIVNNL